MVADDAPDGVADAEQVQRTMSRLTDFLNQETKEGQAAFISLRAVSPQESTSETQARKRLWRLIR
jgi:hypothetical protein